jgi:hypothetical protein
MEKDCGNHGRTPCEKVEEIKYVHTTETVSSLETLTKLTNEFNLNDFGWIFRGQRRASQCLETTLEKKKVPSNDSWKLEALILREFTRRAYHYLNDASIPQSILEWFSLMRHYGAPSRLLDCTYSFNAAQFFALRYLSQPNGCAAIWAISREWLKDCRKEIFGANLSFKCSEEFYDHFLNPDNPREFVSEVNPFRINQRLTAQQGLFLCPGDVGKSFMQNLRKMAESVNPSDEKYHKGIIRIPVAFAIKERLVQVLHQMNISAATLFPDLTGFAEAVGDWFYLPDKIRPSDPELIHALQNRSHDSSEERDEL